MKMTYPLSVAEAEVVARYDEIRRLYILSDRQHQQAQPPRESLVGRSSYDRCFAQ